MTSLRVSLYLPLVLLLFAPSLHCACAEEHVVAEETKTGVPGINVHAKQSPDSPNLASPQRLPSANLPISSSNLIREQAQQQQQQQQAKKFDPKEQTVNLTSHVTPTGTILLDERHTTQLGEGSRLPDPSGGQQLVGDHVRLGSEDRASGTVLLIDNNGDTNAVAPHPGSGRSSRPVRPQQLPPTPDDHSNLSVSLSRSPKELLIVSDNEHLPTPLIHGAEVLPAGRPPLVADVFNANSWIPTDNEKSGGIPLNITEDTGVKVNSTSGSRQRLGDDRGPGRIVASPSPSNDPSQNYSGSLLFQPSVLLLPQPLTTNSGERNSTMSEDEEASDFPIEASPAKSRQQNTRRKNRKSQSQRQQQRSLSLLASAENSTTTGSTLGVETTTQVMKSSTNDNQITGNRRPDDISEADNLAISQPVPNGPHDVHALGQWPPFGHPMDSHGPELPIGNGAGLDLWFQSHPSGAHPQFSPMFPPNWPHQQPGLDVAFFPVNENETTANGSHPIGTDTIFPIIHAPLDQHHLSELPPQERFPDQFLAPGGGLRGNSPYDNHSPRDNHPIGQQAPHPGPPDFIVPSFINPVDRSPASIGPSTPTSSLTGTVPLGFGIQLTDGSTASVTSSSSLSNATLSKNILATEPGRNYGNSPTPPTTSSQSSSLMRSVSVTTGTSNVTLPSATTSGGVTVGFPSTPATQPNNASSSSTANVDSRLSGTAATTVTKRQHVSAVATNEQVTHGSPDVGVRPTEDQQLRRFLQRSTGARPNNGSSICISILLIFFYLSINGDLGTQ